jgi:nitroreductase
MDDVLTDNVTIRTILERRSTREGFTSDPVGRSDIEVILRCGLAAPSSKDAQPWRFHVVTDRALLGRLADLVASAEDADRYVPHDPETGEPRPEFHSTVAESADVLRAAAAAIFIENLGHFSRGRARLLEAGPEGVRASIVGYALELIGIGAAIENMFLAAHSLGLGCAFMGDVMIAEDGINEILGVEVDLAGVLTFAHPAERPLPRSDRPDPILSDAVRWH